MIMRITRGKLHPGAWSAYEQAYKATVVAKSPHIEGLRGRWLAQPPVHCPHTSCLPLPGARRGWGRPQQIGRAHV